MKKFFLTLILIVTPHIIFPSNSKNKKEQISQSHNSLTVSRKEKKQISQSDNSLTVSENFSEPRTPEEGEKAQKIFDENKQQETAKAVRERVEKYMEHTKCHGKLESQKHYINTPGNEEIINNCFNCIDVRELLRSSRLSNLRF